MWEKFGSKRSWSWYGWCIVKFYDFGVWLDFVTLSCVGWKTKILVLENCLDSILTNASRVMWESLGSEGIDLDMVGAKPSSMILVFRLDFVTWWFVGWKTKILVLENELDSILTNALKVMWEKFGSKRNWYWHDWCMAKFHDFCVLAWFCDLVVCVDLKRKSWFWKTGWNKTSQMPPKWCGGSLGAKGIDLHMVGA